MESMATTLLLLPAVYAAMGVVFAVAFMLWGVVRIDSAAKGGSLGFRLMILSGVILLWPVLLMRWLRVVKGGGA